jgi:AP-3 complex subunit delta-1
MICGGAAEEFARQYLTRINMPAVTEHKELILECLNDEDDTIRVRAMDLLVAMATKKSLPDIVKRMLATLSNVCIRKAI